MKIAIVSHTLLATESLRQVLATVSDYQVLWTASDGAEAVTKCAIDRPDLILMDLIMPILDGLQATRQIMSHSPCAILLLTTNLQQHATKVFEALGLGALDAIELPFLHQQGDLATLQPLLPKIANIHTLVSTTVAGAIAPPLSPNNGRLPLSGDIPRHRHTVTTIPLPPATIGGSAPELRLSPLSPSLAISPLLIIGSSTGGPKALATVFSGLPANLAAPIVVVQHVDIQFAQGMVEWLQKHTLLRICLAQEGDYLQSGSIYLAGTNDHLVLRGDRSLGYVCEPLDYPYRPSVDVFFKSAVQDRARPGTAVLLTGMGRDGAEGLLALRQKGWHTIAQDQATSAVYGMPKAAVELGAAVEVLPLEDIAGAMLRSLPLFTSRIFDPP